MTTAEEASTALIRGIEIWTIVLGVAGAIAVWLLWGWRAGAGLAVGALLSWINYRWLKESVISLTAASVAQAGAETVRVPKSAYLKFFGRFVLLVLVAYVILSRFNWPAIAVVAGLFAVVAGVVAAAIAHLLRSLRQT